jgi:hypothetical protein
MVAEMLRCNSMRLHIHSADDQVICASLQADIDPNLLLRLYGQIDGASHCAPHQCDAKRHFLTN